jgi:hypothetical protein
LGGDACGDFDLANWIATSVMILPYESLVVFLDSSFPKQENNYCLSSQEKQHSAIHGRYNKHFCNGGVSFGQPLSAAIPNKAQIIFRTYGRLLDVVIPPLLWLLPPVVDGMVRCCRFALKCLNIFKKQVAITEF